MSRPDEPPTSVLLDIYRRANLAYRADEKFRAMIAGGQLQILYYSPRGQEILAAALMAAASSDDYLVTTYRGMHDQLAKGIPVAKLWAEFAGKSGGTCKGKGGPMHITHPATGVMVTTGIVGSGLPIATGLALASQLAGDGKVTLCCFGDGATNIGAFHEALNLASIWKLPVVFVCQNNRYGEHTPQTMSTGARELVDRAPAYGIESAQVDGNDAFAMYAAARAAVDRARRGAGPTFIEAKTFRFFGHLLGDDSHYIPHAEMQAARAADPVPAYRAALLERGILRAELDAIDAAIAAEVAAAAQFALDDPYPDVAEIRTDVLDKEIPRVTAPTVPKPPRINFTKAINMALDEALAADPRVFLLGEDIADPQGGGVFTATKGLSAKHGAARVRSTPISEQAIVGAAVGAALAGYRPVAEIMLMNFITVAMDQIVNHAAKLRFMSGGQTRVPLTIRTATGAGAGFGGQHSDMLEAWFAHVPGLKIATAANPADAQGLLLSCIEDDNPCIFIEHTLAYGVMGDAPPPGHRVPLGKACVTRVGRDVSVIGYGSAIAKALAAADALAKEGVSVEVVDLRTIAPFDEATVLASVAKTRRAVVVHEAVKSFGVGAEISSRIHEELFGQLRAPVVRVGSAYAPVPFSSVLEQAFLFSQAQIEAAIRRTLG